MSHPLVNGENISWLTGRRAGAKGSASFSWISYWKLVSLGQPVPADTESVTVSVSSLGARDQRKGAWSLSPWLLPHNPTVHLKEQGGDSPLATENGHNPHSKADLQTRKAPQERLPGPRELPKLCLQLWNMLRNCQCFSLRYCNWVWLGSEWNKPLVSLGMSQS